MSGTESDLFFYTLHLIHTETKKHWLHLKAITRFNKIYITFHKTKNQIANGPSNL